MPPIYRIHMTASKGSDKVFAHSAEEAARLISAYLKARDREEFVVILLDATSRVTGINTVSIGSLLSTKVVGREVFKPAILGNAASIIVGHNHPSGDPTPSESDLAITKIIAACGEVMDIEMIDHIIVGENGKFTSLRRLGWKNG